MRTIYVQQIVVGLENRLVWELHFPFWIIFNETQQNTDIQKRMPVTGTAKIWPVPRFQPITLSSRCISCLQTLLARSRIIEERPDHRPTENHTNWAFLRVVQWWFLYRLQYAKSQQNLKRKDGKNSVPFIIFGSKLMTVYNNFICWQPRLKCSTGIQEQHLF